jgi:hypothetical protein
MKAQSVFKGYYDGHIDTYLMTDVSSKSEAKALHVNYSAELKAAKGVPRQFFVKGAAAKGQLTVFGSQPGESDYNPLWKELWVTWKSGVKPLLLVKDDQIDSLEKKGKLTEKDAHIVLNARDPHGRKGRLKTTKRRGYRRFEKLRRRVVCRQPRAGVLLIISRLVPA